MPNANRLAPAALFHPPLARSRIKRRVRKNDIWPLVNVSRANVRFQHEGKNIKKVITIEEFCELSNYTPEKAVELVSYGALEAVRFGFSLLITRDSVDALFDSINEFLSDECSLDEEYQRELEAEAKAKAKAKAKVLRLVPQTPHKGPRVK